MIRRQRLLLIAYAGLSGILAVAIGSELVTTSRLLGSQAATQAPAIGGPFTLKAADGATVTDRTYRGKILLVYFGYTLCPDVCPTTLNKIAEALAKLGPKADAVRPLFVTIDPQRDTAKVLDAYVKAFGPRIIGLTGTPEQIKAAASAYGVYYARYETKDAPDGYLMDHSAIVYVMDRNGHFVEAFNPQTSARQMVERLAKLISQSP